jgi:chromosome segregation ATPase
MADEMIRRSEFLEYMEAFEERLIIRFQAIDARFDGIDQRLDAMDARFGGIDHRLDAMDARFDGIDQRLDAMKVRLDRSNERFDGVDERFDAVDARFDGMDSRLDRLEHSMTVQFEETRGLIRLSLEGLDALRETTERGFAEVRRANGDHKTLLEAALKHVRRRVENVERTRPRKRAR